MAVVTRNVFSPELMYKLPPEERWDYVQEFEIAISRKVLEVLGGEWIAQTAGFDPTKDITWCTTTEGMVDVEIKTSTNRSGTIEVGRFDRIQSGLSATEAHIYLHLSTDKPYSEGEFGRGRKIKVRIYASARLVAEYEKSQGTWIRTAAKPDDHGPGMVGFHVDSRDVFHCWVGDLKGWINDDAQVEYHLDEWLTTNRNAISEFAAIMRYVRKNDPHYEKYDTEDE